MNERPRQYSLVIDCLSEGREDLTLCNECINRDMLLHKWCRGEAMVRNSNESE